MDNWDVVPWMSYCYMASCGCSRTSGRRKGRQTSCRHWDPDATIDGSCPCFFFSIYLSDILSFITCRDLTSYHSFRVEKMNFHVPQLCCYQGFTIKTSMEMVDPLLMIHSSSGRSIVKMIILFYILALSNREMYENVTSKPWPKPCQQIVKYI